MGWQTDNGSILILGKKQTMKTTAARELHAETNRVSIWIMPSGNERIPHVKGGGSPVGSKQALTEAIADGRRHIVWQSSNVNNAVIEFREWAWDIAQETDRQARIQVIIDEIHNVAPANPTKEQLPATRAVQKLSKEGEKRGVKFIAITQHPTSYNAQARSQHEYLMIAKITPEMRQPFEGWGVDWTVVNDLDEHCAAVFQNELDLSSGHGDAKLLEPEVCPKSKHTV